MATFAGSLNQYRLEMLAAESWRPGGRKFLDNFGYPAPGADHAGTLHYDPLFGYWEVRDFFDDDSWLDVIEAARYQIVDTWLDRSAGATQDYHNLTAGLRRHYERT